jgi:predicted metalloprotease with PDZ domain
MLRVSLDTACSSLPCDFQLPAWSATYQMRNFSQYVGSVRAETAEGRQLQLRKIGPSRWRIVPGSPGAVRLV